MNLGSSGMNQYKSIMFAGGCFWCMVKPYYEYDGVISVFSGYAGGLEVLVFPQKWKGMTVRASLGVDLGRLLLKGKINQDWRDSVSKYELTIGLGLHY